jgi:hypothetical protein
MTDGDDVHASGMEYSPTSATGTAWERTPWREPSGEREGEQPMRR